MSISIPGCEILRPNRLGSVRSGEGLDECENITGFGVFDIVEPFGIGHDGHHFLLQGLFVVEESEHVAGVEKMLRERLKD